MEARYYNSIWARFTSEDAVFLELGTTPDLSKILVDPQSLNSYAYARNNPLKYTDPDGKFFTQLFGIIIGLCTPQVANAPGPNTVTVSSPSNAQIAAGAAIGFGTGSLVAEPISATLGTAGLANSIATGAVTAAVAGTTGRAVMGQTPSVANMSNDFIAGGILGAAGYGINVAKTGLMGEAPVDLSRPQGVPENWIAKPSDKSGGMKYINPNNSHEYVRIMPGKPNSPNPAQQEPYVVQMASGKAIDANGNRVSSDSAAAHVPQKVFKFKN